MESNISEKYSLPVRYLHWVSAAIILWTLASGLAIALVPVVDNHITDRIAALNVSLTFFFIPLFLYRLFYRLFLFEQHGDIGPYSKLAHNFHQALYAVTLVVLISGVLMLDHDIHVFGDFFIQNFFKAIRLNDFFGHIHVVSTRVLGVMVILHVLAVIKHEMNGEHVLRRMR